MRVHRFAMPGLLLVVALVLLAGGLLIERPTRASAQNAGGSWSPVTVLYLSDTRGKIEPCG
jgi:hypothetical protein